MKIADRIKLVRARLRMEQSDLSTLLGMPLSTFGKYERGERSPGTEALDKFNSIGINANWLITGHGDMFTDPVTMLARLLVEGRGDRTLEEMAADLQIEPTLLKRYELGVAAPDEEFLKRFQLSATGDPVRFHARMEFVLGLQEIIADLRKSVDERADNPYQTEPIEPLQSGSGEKPRVVANDHPRSGDDGYLYIDKYVDVKGACGPGREVGEETVVQVRVDARLLRERVGNNFNSIKIAGVSGDSMEPTLSHGDQVLIDTSCTRFVDDAIYAIQQDGFLRFKRIQLKLDGSIIVKSDNPVNGPETYTAEQAQYFKVIGVVIPFKFGRFKL